MEHFVMSGSRSLSVKLSVVIVNYNVKYYVDQCVRSVLRAFRRTEALNAELIVVDNHSSDGSVEYLSSRYPQAQFPMLRFVSCSHNLGFARANNIAIRQSDAQYVLLLNPDTIVGETVLGDCLQFMDSHPDAAALGVCMHDATGRAAMESRRGLPTPMVAFYKMLGLCNRWPKSHLFGRYYMGYLPWDEPGRIEVVSGAFCMLRRKAIDEVGLLDEDFFMYGEDIDLSYRLLQGGYHNYYIPVDILHYKGESTVKSSFRYVHVFYEAMLIFFRKHYSGMSLLLSVPIKTAIYAKATVALARMLTGRMRKSLGFFSNAALRQRFVFVGSEPMLVACRQISLFQGLDAAYLPLEEWHGQEVDAQVGMMTYVVFDADAIDYQAMLGWMAKHPRENVQLGVYAAEIGKIITEQEVL